MNESKLLAVAAALPRQRVTAGQLAQAHGLDEQRVAGELGLSCKAVATADDEHPADFCVRAAARALAALGATADDVGLVIAAGCSREYLPSWSIAIEVIGRLGARRALGYDLGLGCAAALLAVDQAARRPPMAAPLTLVVSAERWSHTLSNEVPFPLALLAHADGGAAGVLGAGSGLHIGPLHGIATPEYNDFVQIPAGGTRHPASLETVRSGQHFRTARRAAPEELRAHYVQGYSRVITKACGDLGVPPAALDVLVINQVRRQIRESVRAALSLGEGVMIDTYPRLGHLGGADLFLGLAQAQRKGRLADRRGVLSASTLSTFAACSFVADPAGIAISGEAEEDPGWI
jgi:3-oxoacyl-[acyl-carrier-protein] synthase-3